MTTEPLDLEPIEARDAPYSQDLLDGWAELAARHGMVPERAIIDRRTLLAEVRKLSDEITDRANVEADLRAQLAETKAEADMWANR